MPTINDRSLSQKAKAGRALWRPAVVRPAAIAVALSLGIAGCAPVKNSEPSAAAGARSPIKVELLPGPSSLAPSITGAAAASSAPTRRPASPPAPAAAAASPAPAPPPTPATAAAAPAPTVSPADAVPIPTGKLASCPPGTIAMWSEPDVIGVRVAICHALRSPK
jgi:hypothetical protein